MMNFKNVEIEDKPVIEGYLSQYGRIHCDASFECLFLSRDQYRPQWCVEQGSLIVRFISEDNTLEYLQPIGRARLSDIIPILEKDASAKNSSFVIYGVTPSFVKEMRREFPLWGFAPDRRFSDYIYRLSDIRVFPGHDYHEKRRIVKQFAAAHSFRYEELAPSMFAECIELEKRWLESKMAEGEGIPAERLERDLRWELDYIETAFKHYERLPLRGAAIYVEDRMVAFNFGSAIGDDVFCCHIQKADPGYKSAFTVVLNQLALHLPDKFKYIDLEWDDGLPGLRTAKKRFLPAWLSEEVNARRLADDELRIRELWLQCFPQDTIDDAESFILNRLGSSLQFCRRIDGKIASVIYVIPFGDSAYLYAGMTAAEHRGKGLYRSVVLEAIESCRLQGFRNAVVIYPDSGIENWYRRIGFRGRYHITFKTNDEFDFGSGDTSCDIGCVLPLCSAEIPEGDEIVLSEIEDQIHFSFRE